MDIEILGPLRVLDGARPVELPSRQVRLLLTALTLQANKVVSTDRLYEILWGDRLPDSAANTLQTYVNHLRNAFEPDRPSRQPGRFVHTRPPGYVLTIEPDRIDADRFAALAARGHVELETAPDKAAVTLRDALALWRGDALAEVSFEPFAQCDIARLNELRLTALEDRIAADLALGAHTALAGELAQLALENPLRERLHAQLMTTLYRCGRQADALSVADELRRRLRDQLGLDPSPEIARLTEAILRQDALLEPTPPGGGTVDLGRQAAREHRWADAIELLGAAEALDGLGLTDLADAQLWAGHPHEALDTRQRAHQAFLDAGDRRSAALVAMTLCVLFAARLRSTVAAGWFQRAQRLLEDEPEGPEHGFLAGVAALSTMHTDDPAAALVAARRAYEIGVRFEVADLQALGLCFEGFVLVRQGHVDEGMRLMDEGMTWAVAGGLQPLNTQLIFCNTVRTCYELGDYRRAAEWIDAIADCLARSGVDAFPGDCELHSIGILVGRGAWAEGERRARRASGDLELVELTHVGLALSEIGEIRLRQGDLDGAGEAFARATAHAAPPQPGVALLLLARGDPAAAAESIAAALAEESWNQLTRARLLPAQVEIAIANGDLTTAASAAAELGAIASTYATQAFRAASDWATGALLLARDETALAEAALRRAVEAWKLADAPYEAAKARLLLARALHAQDDPRAVAEADVAAAAFHSLGAQRDLQAALELRLESAGRAAGTRPSRL